MVQNYWSWYVLRYCGCTNNQTKLNLCLQHGCFEHATKQQKQKEIAPVFHPLSPPTNKGFKTMHLKNKL